MRSRLMLKTPQLKAPLLKALCYLALFAAFAPAPAGAQNFPARPLHLIVPFAAGGPVDLIARPFAEKMTETLGQPMVVENMGGGGTIIGTDHVAKAAPDGYTLLVTSAAVMIVPSSYPKLPFDVIKDFAPVSVMSSSTIVLVADPKLPFRTVPELVAYAKANPGKLSFGSSGTGGSLHLGGEMLNLMAGIETTHIPYKGAAPALTDIMGGHVSMMFVSMAAVLPLSTSGKVRAIAVASLKPAAALPGVPTMDSFYPGFEVTAGNAVLAPAKTPRPIITRLNQAMAKALGTQDLKDRFAKSGVEALSTTPEEAAADVRNEIARWGKVVKAINFVATD